jgi:hypothetical protein
MGQEERGRRGCCDSGFRGKTSVIPEIVPFLMVAFAFTCLSPYRFVL